MIPVFELHIRPLFRTTDREHMMFAVDLWDYDSVVAHADDILDRVKINMPPGAEGGPWPDEWVTLFQRWTETGHRRLTLGTATYTLKRTATAVTLTATGTYPAAGVHGWLQVESETDTTKTFVFFLQDPDDPDPGAAQPFTLKERFAATDTRSVFVHDSAGTQEVVAPA
jgi:hypothetical protein